MRSLLFIVALSACSFDPPADVVGPSTLVIVEGDNQQGIVGTSLAIPLQVRVVDGEKPRPDVSVDFAVSVGDGAVAQATVRTDPLGNASTVVTLGTVAGQITVDATADAIASGSVVFHATALAAAPATLVKVSGDDQQVTALIPAEPFVVEVRDAFGNVTPNAIVDFIPLQIAGALSSATATTDSDGRAETVLTAGTLIGSHVIEARVAGVSGSAIFDATTRNFDPPIRFANASGGQILPTIADFNGDGKIDLAFVVVGSPNHLRVMINTTQSSVLSFRTSDFTDELGQIGNARLVAADVNSDGKLDLLFDLNGTTSVLLSTTPNGAEIPTFTTSVATAPAAVPVALSSRPAIVVDFDADGRDDLLVTSGGGGFVCRNTSAGNTISFACVSRFLGATPRVVDVDGDARPDLVVANSFIEHDVFLNVGGAFAAVPAATLPNGLVSNLLVTLDIDGDGRRDVIDAGFMNTTHVVRFVRNTTAVTGTPTFGAPTTISSAAPLAALLGAADFNGDGKPDLLGLAGDNTAGVLLDTSAGAQHFGALEPFEIQTSGLNMLGADLNGDGRADLVSFHTAGFDVRLTR